MGLAGATELDAIESRLDDLVESEDVKLDVDPPILACLARYVFSC